MADKRKTNERLNFVVVFGKKKRESPLKVDKSFDEVLRAMARSKPVSNKRLQHKDK